MWTGFSPFVKNIENNRQRLKQMAEQEEQSEK
jgi:hypothetical protein